MNDKINNEIEKTLNLLETPEGIEASPNFADIVCQRVQQLPDSKIISVCGRTQEIPQASTVKLDNSSFYFKAAVLLLALNAAAVITLFTAKNNSANQQQSTGTYSSVMANEYLAGSGFNISF